MIDNFLKNPINKFLLWFAMGLFVCLIGISNVFADEITFQVYDYQVYYDNSGSSVSQVGQSWSSSFMAYVSNNITTTANSYGAGVVINSGIPIISGHAYSLSLYFEERHNIALSSKNRIAIGSSVSNSASNYANANYNATMITSKVINATTLQFAFTANSSNQFIFIPWTTTSTTTQTYVFTSYLINDLGASSGVSQSDINNSLNSQTNTLNQSITNSQNAIIQNQNQNAEDTQNTIINNGNQDIINNSLNSCGNQIKFTLKKGKQFTTSGGLQDNSDYYYTSDFTAIGNTSQITFVNTGMVGNDNAGIILVYDSNYNYLDWWSIKDRTINLPSGATYFKLSTKIPTILLYQGSGCVNRLDELNDNITNNNVDENGIASAFDSFNNYLDDNSTITQLITLPVTLYTAILNNLNGTCQPFNLGKLYGSDLILPCINISQYLGNALWSMIDIIISGFAIYAISKKMIKVFNNFSSLREGDVIDD